MAQVATSKGNTKPKALGGAKLVTKPAVRPSRVQVPGKLAQKPTRLDDRSGVGSGVARLQQFAQAQGKSAMAVVPAPKKAEIKKKAADLKVVPLAKKVLVTKASTVATSKVKEAKAKAEVAKAKAAQARKKADEAKAKRIEADRKLAAAKMKRESLLALALAYKPRGTGGILDPGFSPGTLPAPRSLEEIEALRRARKESGKHGLEITGGEPGLLQEVGLILGPPVHKDQGRFVPLLSDRLSIGESAALELAVGATFPLEEFGVPNLKVDTEGSLKIKRVAKPGLAANQISRPESALPSMLEVTLELRGKVGLSVSGELGVSLGTTVNGTTAGLRQSVGGSVESGVQGRVSYTFAFDPANSADMAVLESMVKATASTAAKAAIPGLGKMSAFASVAVNRKSFADFGRHLTRIEGDGGLYSQIRASAESKIGLFQDGAAGHTRSLSEGAADPSRPKLPLSRLQIGEVKVEFGGERSWGFSQDLRTREMTRYYTEEAEVGATAKLLSLGGSTKAKAKRKISEVRGPDGQLNAIRVEDVVDLGAKVGLLQGAQGQGQKLRITREQRLRDPGNPKAGPRTLLPETILVRRDELSLEVEGKLDLGAQIRLKGGLALIHEEEASIKA